jgi:3-dehydroquinate synthase
MLHTERGAALGAPKKVDLASTLEKFDYDKKHRTDFYRMVTPVGDGELKLISVARDVAEKEKIKAAYIAACNAVHWTYH